MLNVDSAVEQVGPMEDDAEDHAPDDAAMIPPPAPPRPAQPENEMED